MNDWEDMFASAARQRVRRDGVALETLRALCETNTPCSLMAAHMALSSAGHLRSATSAGVVVHLLHPPRSPLQGALVALSFPLAGKSAGFTGPVLWVAEQDGGSLDVTLQVPEALQLKMRRASVRVPVPSGTMGAAILHGESLQPVIAIDLSLQGILVEFREGEVPDIEEGHRRMVALKLEGKSVLLEAEVRRRDGPRYGMAFITRDDRPRKLIEILTTLQYRWSERAVP